MGVAVGVAVVGMLMSTVLMTVPFYMPVVALMEEEREHTQETELGVHLDSHGPVTSGTLPEQERNRTRVWNIICLKVEIKQSFSFDGGNDPPIYSVLSCNTFSDLFSPTILLKVFTGLVYFGSHRMWLILHPYLLVQV